MPIIPAVQWWREVNQEFKANLCYVAVRNDTEASLGYMRPTLKQK